MHRQTEKNAYRGARVREGDERIKRGEKGKKREIKRVTKVAPIALSAPFLGDLLRFCRNPIALSAIKPESCPVKGWYGGRRAKTESVTIGKEAEREREKFSLRCRVEKKGVVKYRGTPERGEKGAPLCVALLRGTSRSSSW